MRGSLVLSLFLLLSLSPLLRAGSTLSSPVDVEFVSEADGTTQRYLIMEPSQPEGRDVLIALHGHGSDRWQFATGDRDEVRAARDVAAAHGMLYVCPDYRPAPPSWMGPAAEADLVQIIRDLKRNRGVENVYVCGGSMGGTAALIFAARQPALVQGVASMNGTANMIEYDRFQEAIHPSYGGTQKDAPEEYYRRSPELFPLAFTMPVGIAAGGKDELVPADSVLRLGRMLQRLGKEVCIVYREEGGHATTYEDARTILEFVLDPGAQEKQ